MQAAGSVVGKPVTSVKPVVNIGSRRIRQKDVIVSGAGSACLINAAEKSGSDAGQQGSSLYGGIAERRQFDRPLQDIRLDLLPEPVPGTASGNADSICAGACDLLMHFHNNARLEGKAFKDRSQHMAAVVQGGEAQKGSPVILVPAGSAAAAQVRDIDQPFGTGRDLLQGVKHLRVIPLFLLAFCVACRQTFLRRSSVSRSNHGRKISRTFASENEASTAKPLFSRVYLMQ